MVLGLLDLLLSDRPVLLGERTGHGWRVLLIRAATAVVVGAVTVGLVIALLTLVAQMAGGLG